VTRSVRTIGCSTADADATSITADCAASAAFGPFCLPASPDLVAPLAEEQADTAAIPANRAVIPATRCSAFST